MSARCSPGVVVGWSRSRGHSRFGGEGSYELEKGLFNFILWSFFFLDYVE